MRCQFYMNARMLVIKDRKVLMGYEPKQYGHGGNHWETPGGSIKEGENIFSALSRESKEEIGTKVNIRNHLPFIFTYASGDLNKEWEGKYGIVMFFLCDTLSNPDLKKARQKEFNELKFIGKKEFDKLKKEKKLMYFDEKYIPGMMRKLKLW